MTHKFVYDIRMYVTVTKAEIIFLRKVASHHYDGHCRSVAACGGFLYGMMNRADFDEEGGTQHLLDNNNFQTLAKILEPGNIPRGMDEKLGKELSDRFWEGIRATNAEYLRLNPRPSEGYG